MITSAVVRLVAWVWLFAAMGAGHFLLLQRLPVMATPAIVLSLVTALIFVHRRSAAFRTWVAAIPLRTLVLLHLTRLVGFAFIYFADRGELPRAFALQAGWGDIVVAALALPIAFWGIQPQRIRLVYIWNVIGFLDILLVVVSAARLGFSDPGSVQLFTRLPLSLLPTFLVPLIIASHLLIFQRLAAAEPRHHEG